MAIFLPAYQPKDPPLLVVTAGYKRGYISGLSLCVELEQESTAVVLTLSAWLLSVCCEYFEDFYS